MVSLSLVGQTRRIILPHNRRGTIRAVRHLIFADSAVSNLRSTGPPRSFSSRLIIRRIEGGGAVPRFRQRTTTRADRRPQSHNRTGGGNKRNSFFPRVKTRSVVITRLSFALNNDGTIHLISRSSLPPSPPPSLSFLGAREDGGREGAVEMTVISLPCGFVHRGLIIAHFRRVNNGLSRDKPL